MDLPSFETTSAAALAAAQANHAAQLQQVEEALDKLAAAHQSLAAVEAEIAKLTRLAVTEAPRDVPLHARNGVSLILNPAAKTFLDGNHSPDEVLAALDAVGIAAQLTMTTPETNAHQLASAAIEQGDNLIIVAGGDGTIGEVATALINSPATLGILPLGTMNNVARTLGIPLDLSNAALLLAMGITRRIDVGHVITPHETLDGYFLESAGVGLSAMAAPMGEDAEKGRWAEVISKLGDFLAFTSTHVTVGCDDEETTLEAHTNIVTISNAPIFGNNMLIAPNAKIDDGLLDVAVYEGMALIDLVRYFYGISNGGRMNDVRIRFRRARRVRVTAAVPLAVNADLDVLDEQHAWEVEVIPRALTVVVGNGPGLTFPVEAAPAPPPVAGPQPPSSSDTA